METGDHFKNGAGTKSHTSSRIFLRKAVICAIMASAICFSANHLAAQDLTSEYTQWYISVLAGASLQGCDAISNVLELQGAYFFNRQYGGGLVVRKCNYHSSREYFPDDLFIGAAFFAHWGRSGAKLFFPAKIGFGIDQHTYYHSSTRRYFTETGMGGYASAGIAIRPVKWISFGINAEFASHFEYMDEECFGINLGVSVHF